MDSSGPPRLGRGEYEIVTVAELASVKVQSSLKTLGYERLLVNVCEYPSGNCPKLFAMKLLPLL
jgi:hypothetical protein